MKLSWINLLFLPFFFSVTSSFDGASRVTFPISASDNGHIGPANEAAVANGIGTTTDSSTAAGESLIDSGVHAQF